MTDDVVIFDEVVLDISAATAELVAGDRELAASELTLIDSDET